MKKVLITGAGGFLGSYLIERLMAKNEFLICAMSSQAAALRENYPETTNFTVTDSRESCSYDYSDVDTLVNCAFPRIEDGLQMAQGLDYVFRLLAKAADDGVGAVINISSQCVYSQKRKTPADENEPINLESTYAVGKYAVELMLREKCRMIPFTNLRLASLIGAGFDQRITNKYLNQAKNGQPLHVNGGSQRFGFLDVRDAAAAIEKIIIGDPQTWKTVYNVGSEESYSLLQIAQSVSELCNFQLGKQAKILMEKSDSWRNLALESALFCKQFSWHPEYRLQDTLKWIYAKMRDKEL